MPWKLKNPAAADIAPDWLQPYCTQFLRKLSDQGYALVTLRSYDGAAALLCHEVSRRGLRSDQLVGATLTKARAAALGKMHPNRYDQKKYCLDRFIDALVEAGVAKRPAPKKVRSSPLDRLRLEYVAYLRDQRGLTEATIYHCVCFLSGPAKITATIFSDAGGWCSSIQDGTCGRGCRGLPFRRR
jgi:integrase/recombinase XerD